MIEGDYKKKMKKKKNNRKATTIMCIYIEMYFVSRKKTIHTKYGSERTNQKKPKTGCGLNLSVHNELATFAIQGKKPSWNK